MPPLTCPSPEPAPDCGLYSERAVYAPGEMLRRAVLRERHRHVSLRSLIRAEALQAEKPPPPTPPALPAPSPISSPFISVNTREKGSS
jgi:hypothetical protein